jgi:hypothetical protein
MYIIMFMFIYCWTFTSNNTFFIEMDTGGNLLYIMSNKSRKDYNFRCRMIYNN